ncbi:MAG: cytochrome c family protein [Proteobacteria bacterium]|nr:cytochrome c family protein [Pseudomonadota bacterium]MDA1022359.1 cytochrome c family protein [Pseudomonadota bacterium]
MKKEIIAAVLLTVAMAFAGTSAMAAGDAAKGKKVFNKCKACHTVDKGGKNRVGPNLFGIAGKKAGSVDGYKYSSAMIASGVTWDDASLDKFLKKPKDFVKKTKMGYSGLKDDGQREDVIAYLKSLK